MKDYGIDVYAQCIGGKVVLGSKPLVFKDDNKPFVKSIDAFSKANVGMMPKREANQDVF